MVMKIDNSYEADNSIIIRGARQHKLKNIAPIIMLKLKAIGVAAGMEKKLKEFSMAPKKATKDTKNR